VVGPRPSSSSSTWCVVPLGGDWTLFCHAGSGRVGRVLSTRENSLEILHLCRELNPGHREDRQWDTFVLPLSYHDCHYLYWTEMWPLPVTACILTSLFLNFTSLAWSRATGSVAKRHFTGKFVFGFWARIDVRSSYSQWKPVITADPGSDHHLAVRPPGDENWLQNQSRAAVICKHLAIHIFSDNHRQVSSHHWSG